MLSRLHPAKQVLRANALKAATAKFAPAEVNSDVSKVLFMTMDQKEAAVGDFAAKQAAAGIVSFNIVPQHCHDPVIAAGLGKIVGFNDFIPLRIRGQCSEEVLEKTLNIYNDMRADGAKAYQIKATLGPMFQEHYKEIEAARTDQVPRIRRMNLIAEDLGYLYAGPAKVKDGKSYIQGSRVEHAWSIWNFTRQDLPRYLMHGHPNDASLFENADDGINGILNKNEIWAHSGEHVLNHSHSAWLGNFVLEAENSAGETCSVAITDPWNAFLSVGDVCSFSEETQAAVAAAGSADEKAAVVAADDKATKSLTKVTGHVSAILNKDGDNRPNATSGPLNRIIGTLNGEGTPSQQLEKYSADAATIEKFAGFQNVLGIYPKSNSTLNDAFGTFGAYRTGTAKYNTQTIHGKANHARAVSSFVSLAILYAVL